jgi:hypothetical protein
VVTWLTKKNATLANATTAYIRAMYHIYAQFDSGGDWYNYGQIIDVSAAANFATEAAVQSGDWFVVHLANTVNNEFFEFFVGARSGAGALGPYTVAASGLYISCGFTGNWSSSTGFLKDSGLLLLSDDTGDEVWKFHMALSTDLCIFFLFGATDGVTAANDFDIAFQVGEYNNNDATDHFKTFIICGDPNTGAGANWDNENNPRGRSFSEFDDIVINCCMRTYVNDASLEGKGLSTYLFMKSMDICLIKDAAHVGLLGNPYGVYQCKDTGINNGDTTTYGGHDYINSGRTAYIYD